MRTGFLAMSAALPLSRRGAFILFEGIDRCGKSTQSTHLAKALPNAELIRFPNRETVVWVQYRPYQRIYSIQQVIGQIISSYLGSSSELSDETIHLLFSANRWEAVAALESKLTSGTHLICIVVSLFRLPKE